MVIVKLLSILGVFLEPVFAWQLQVAEVVDVDVRKAFLLVEELAAAFFPRSHVLRIQMAGVLKKLFEIIKVPWSLNKGE